MTVSFHIITCCSQSHFFQTNSFTVVLHCSVFSCSFLLFILCNPLSNLELTGMSYVFYRFSGSGEHCAHLTRLPAPSSCSLWLELPKCHSKVLQPWKAWMGFRNFKSTAMIVQQTVCLLRTHGINPLSLCLKTSDVWTLGLNVVSNFKHLHLFLPIRTE
jgi:hypothetical protein